MVTVSFYISILLLSTFFTYISEKGKGPLERNFFLLISFLIIFLPSAIRYDIGTDYLSYVRVYQNPAITTAFEPAYKLISSILQGFHAHYQWLFIITSFLFSAIFTLTTPRKRGWIYTFIIVSSLFFFSLSAIRQSIAIVFSLAAITYFLDQKYKKFAVFSLIACSFHLSALVFTLITLTALIPISETLKKHLIPKVFIITIVSLFFISTFLFPYFERFFDILGIVKFSNYFENTKYFVSTNVGSGIGVYSKIIFTIYFLLQSKYIVTLSKNYWLIIILIFFYGASQVLGAQISIFGRMSPSFSVAVPFATIILLELRSGRQLNRLVVGLFLVLMFIFFIKDGYVSHNASGSSRKINPYQYIFQNNINKY